MPRTRLDIKNGVEINSVGSFLDILKNKKEAEEENSYTYFFRGQAAEYWDISSSIFRENMLGIEHELLKIPLTKIPTEFDLSQSTFDLMTKYQHYGLCTRLLDITTNPLVALYFACKIMGSEKYEKENRDNNKKDEDREPWGIVYYKKAYPDYADRTEVKIVAKIAQYNLENTNSIQEIIIKLYKDGIISLEEKNRWIQPKNYSKFIDIIQKNYTIIPTYNNTRLAKQNGAFLLPSMYTVVKDRDEYKITKTCGSLKGEFEEEFFYIDGDNKYKILQELDICNINEYTLFPELEHQLNYIKTSNAKNYTAPTFVKYTEEQKEDKPKIILMDNYETSNNFKEELQSQLQYIANKKIESIIYSNIIGQVQVDWYKNKNVQSNMRFKITKALMKEKIDKQKCIEIAKDSIEKAIKIIEKHFIERQNID